MPPAVRRIFDREAGSSDSVGSGTRLVAKYRVQTRDEIAALSAPGVPQIGDVYSIGTPGLVVVSRRSVVEGGKDDANGVGGVTSVYVEYAERNYQWSSTVKEVQPAGVKHTVIRIGNESVEVGAGVNDSGMVMTAYYTDLNTLATAAGAANNGKPMSKQVGRIQAEVYDFRPLTYAVPYSTLIGLASDKALNSDAVTLPAPLGTATAISLQPKQALYMGFEVDVRPDAVLVKHQLELATDFYFRWAIIDKDGKPTGTLGAVQLYRATAFTGLW
jgi:hypothetical protein